MCLKKLSWLKLKKDTVVILGHSQFGTIIKRVCDVTKDHFYLKGDDISSVSTEKIGQQDLNVSLWLPLFHIKKD